MNIKLCAFALFVVFGRICSAADTPKADAVKNDALRAAAVDLFTDPDGHYQLRDQGRGGFIFAIFKTSRPIAVGTVIIVADDMWEVTSIMISTELQDPRFADAKLKFYRTKMASLVVKHIGKMKPSQ
jgi:hypothetical protein